MNRELAKQLKDAGFPQNPFFEDGAIYFDGSKYFGGKGGRYLLTMAQYKQSCEVQRVTVLDCIKIPTLEELIEACGEDMFMLRKLDMDGKWIASRSIFNGEMETRFEADAATKKETVARLWLALNKK